MRSYLDIPYVENATAEQMMDMFLPEGNEFDTMIWFHGGGLEYGSYKTSRKLLESYAANNVGLVSAGYRKYPHARFPDFLEDAAEAVAFAIRRLRELGVKGRIFIQGESAGAYITMMLCMDHRYLERHGVKQEQIAGYISDSAQQFCHFNVLREAGEDPRLERIDERAPIYFLSKDLSLRPLLIIYYENDMHCRPEENKLMYASLRGLLPDAQVELVEIPGKHISLQKDPTSGHVLSAVHTMLFMERVGKSSSEK